MGVAKKNFLGVVSGLPRVINSRFNLSASLFYLQYSHGEPHFPVFMESELLATGPASLGIHEALDPYTCKASCGSRPRASACSHLLTYASLTSWYAVRVQTLWPNELLLGTKKFLLRHESQKPRSRRRVLFLLPAVGA